MGTRACILGCLGARLTDSEKEFFRDANPWGFILFARNIETPEQLTALTDELRSAVGRDAPILIDQEGGRVARMRLPHWQEWLPALDFVNAIAPDQAAKAVELRSRLIARDLKNVGIDVNCTPILDLANDQTHPVILNRCFGTNPETVARLGRAIVRGQTSGGVLSIMKHIPGHGRASLDTHKELPRLDASLAELMETDFKVFASLADLPMAMTAHIVFSAIDPDNPITLSKAGVDMIRDDIGFKGLLMTDDLSMHALKGDFASRVERATSAGCDMILHCNGKPEEMEPVVSAVPELSGVAAERAERALAARQEPDGFDAEEAVATLNTLGVGPVHG